MSKFCLICNTTTNCTDDCDRCLKEEENESHICSFDAQYSDDCRRYCGLGVDAYEEGDLIAVNNNLYEYGGIQEGGLHKVYVIDIDEEGILTHTYIPWYVTDEEISNRGVKLTEKQWLGLTEHFIHQEEEEDE